LKWILEIKYQNVKLSPQDAQRRNSSSTKIELSQSLFSNENYPVKDTYFGAGFHNFDFLSLIFAFFMQQWPSTELSRMSFNLAVILIDSPAVEKFPSLRFSITHLPNSPLSILTIQQCQSKIK